MGYGGGRRRLTLTLDREASSRLDELAALAGLSPEAFANRLLRSQLLEG